jgi:small subunit ribosomal protein S2
MEKKSKKAHKFDLPELQEFLKAGVQFGHQAKKWNPLMEKYIFTKRGDIHIIDLSKSLPMLEKAMEYLAEVASAGEILFVGTKRQASEIVKAAAIDAGAHYIVNRWPGGLLTNFKLIQQGLKNFRGLEEDFETGVADRTKFEVSQMKKDWIKMNRLYEGIKLMSKHPKALVIVDAKYERGAVKEAAVLGIPVIALVDTNTNPAGVDYPIPANDDAIKSIKLIIEQLAIAVKKGNEGRGIKHNFKDYSKAEVEIKKTEVQTDDVVEVESTASAREKDLTADSAKSPSRVKVKKSDLDGSGMLEKIQKEAETRKVEKAKASR